MRWPALQWLGLVVMAAGFARLELWAGVVVLGRGSLSPVWPPSSARRGIDMGLANLLTRSSPNMLPANLSPSPVPGSTFMPGPEQQWPPNSVLPPPSESSALSVPAFWRGCAIVAGGVGMLPVNAFRGTDALDPQPAVLRQPDPNQTPMAFWAGVTESLALYGNSICIVSSRDRLGYPQSLKPIHPTLAAVRFTGNPMAPTIDEWYIAGQMYDPTDVWHVKSHLGAPAGRSSAG